MAAFASTCTHTGDGAFEHVGMLVIYGFSGDLELPSVNYQPTVVLAPRSSVFVCCRGLLFEVALRHAAQCKIDN